MLEDRPYLPGDEILHPWSSAIVPYTLLRNCGVHNTGSEQEKKWGQIAETIYTHMSTRHDVAARVLQSFFFSEHSCHSNSHMKEVKSKMQEMCQYVRRRRQRMVGIKEGTRPCSGTGHESSSPSMSSSSTNDEGGVVEEVAFISRFMEEAFATGGGVSLSSILCSVTAEGRRACSPPFHGAHETPHLSILGDINPLLLAWRHYCLVEKSALRQQCLLANTHNSASTRSSNATGVSPKSSSTGDLSQRRIKDVEKEGQHNFEEEEELQILFSVSRKRLRSSTPTPAEYSMALASSPGSLPTTRNEERDARGSSSCCPLEGSASALHSSVSIPPSLSSCMRSSSSSVVSWVPPVQGRHAVEGKRDPPGKTGRFSSFVGPWWESMENSLLVPLLFSSEPGMRDSVEAYVASDYGHHHRHSITHSEGSPVVSSRVAMSSVALGSLSEARTPVKTIPVEIPPSSRSEEEKNTKMAPHEPQPRRRRRFYAAPSYFPFCVVPLHQRRAAALLAEESRLATTLIRPDVSRLAVKSAVDAAHDSAPPTLWQEAAAGSEDSSSSLTASSVSSSSSDNEEEEGEVNHYSKRALPQGLLTLEEAERKRKQIESGEEKEDNTTYIEHGELVVTNGRIHMRAIPQKRRRGKEKQDDTTEGNIRRRSKTAKTGPVPAPPLKEGVVASGVPPPPPCPPPSIKTEESTTTTQTSFCSDDGKKVEPPSSMSKGTGVEDNVKREESLSQDSASSTVVSSTVSSTKGDAWAMFREKLLKNERKNEGGDTSTGEDSPTKKKGTGTARRRGRGGVEGGSTSSRTKGNRYGGGKKSQRSRSTPSLTAVSVQGVPKLTREEMKEILLSNAWPGLTPILREAFLIGVEEPISEIETSGQNERKEEVAGKQRQGNQ